MLQYIKKITNAPIQVKASIAYMFTSAIQKGLQLITNPIYTRMLSQEAFGRVSLYLTWQNVLGIIAMFCLSYGVFNNGMQDYPEDRDGFSLSMLGLSNLITVIFGIVMVCLYPWLQAIVSIPMHLLLWCFVIFLFQPAMLFWAGRQRFEYRYITNTIATVLMSVLSPAVAILAIYSWHGDAVDARIFGAESVMLVFYVFFYVLLFIKCRGKISTKYWGYAIKFNYALIPHYLCTYLIGHSNSIIISSLIGDKETALYSIAYSASTIATLIWTSINASLVPFTYDKCSKKEYSAIAKTSSPLVVLYGAFCVLLSLIAPEAVSLFATKEYAEGAYVIPALMGGAFFQALYHLFANILYYEKKPKYVMFGSLTAAVLNIVINWLLIPVFGFRIAGYVTMLCFMLQAVIDFIAMRKYVKCNVYDMKVFLGTTLIVVFVSFFVVMLYPFDWIRYAICVCALLAAIIFRNKLLSIIMKHRK